MLAPTNKKQLQRLTGKLVALGRFIARFTDKVKPFFLALRDVNKSGWTQSCQNAFEEIKRYLSQPPILSSPQPGERLYLYLVITDWAVSAILLRSLSPESKDPYISSAKRLPMQRQGIQGWNRLPWCSARPLKNCVPISKLTP